jgi:hypothetical protein
MPAPPTPELSYTCTVVEEALWLNMYQKLVVDHLQSKPCFGEHMACLLRLADDKITVFGIFSYSRSLPPPCTVNPADANTVQNMVK